MRRMSRVFMLIAWLLGAVVTPAALAETATGAVSTLGCHNVNDECWVTLSGYSGSAYCNHSGQLRWDTSPTWGRRWHAMLMAAQVSGKNVSLQISDSGCSASGFPTFLWGTVSD